LLCREDIAQNVVHGDADGADQNFPLCYAAIASASVFGAAATSAGELGRTWRRNRQRPKQPSCNKNNTNNFGPHRSMFLSMGFNR
jgi:hypothetical protein